MMCSRWIPSVTLVAALLGAGRLAAIDANPSVKTEQPAAIISAEGGGQLQADAAGSQNESAADSQPSQPAQYQAPAAPAAPAAALKKKQPPPPQPWKILFQDNDFSYKKDPDHDWLLGEDLKEIPLEFADEEITFSYGSEVRYRFMDESNRLRPGGPARANYDLWRWRQYVDVKFDNFARIYVEGIDASMFRNPLPVTGIDVNRWDLQQAFIDVNIFELDDKPVTFRAGRQELLYGSQRLVSPLDWANTRRNFEGLKLFRKGEEWDLDLWMTRPVNTATVGDGPVARFDNSFDTPNLDHLFSGAWLTYKGVKDQTWDLYWLWDKNNRVVAKGFPGGNRHTIATRWLRNFPVLVGDTPERTYLVDIEGGYQFGDDFGKNVNAGFATGGIGHSWNKAPWEPTLWFFYDYASGSHNLNGGTSNTFNQQYGLTHAFLGQIDNVARQNISDINGKISVKPIKQLVFETQYHWLDLATENDVLYTITGQPLGKPHSGQHVGDELDLLLTYTVNPNFNVQLGYFWFWYGSFVEKNAPRGDAEQFYVQTTLRY